LTFGRENAIIGGYRKYGAFLIKLTENAPLEIFVQYAESSPLYTRSLRERRYTYEELVEQFVGTAPSLWRNFNFQRERRPTL